MKHIAAAIAAFSVAAAAVAADEGSVKALLDEYVEKGLVAGVVSGISDASGEAYDGVENTITGRPISQIRFFLGGTSTSCTQRNLLFVALTVATIWSLV